MEDGLGTTIRVSKYILSPYLGRWGNGRRGVVAHRRRGIHLGQLRLGVVRRVVLVFAPEPVGDGFWVLCSATGLLG